MKFKKVIIKKARGLQNISEEGEIVFDASMFDEGIILIDSPNTSGKSTLLSLCLPIPEKILQRSYEDFTEMFSDEGGEVINEWEDNSKTYFFHFEIPPKSENKPPKAWIEIEQDGLRSIYNITKNEKNSIQIYKKNFYSLFQIRPEDSYEFLLRNPINTYTLTNAERLNDIMLSVLQLDKVELFSEGFDKSVKKEKIQYETSESKLDFFRKSLETDEELSNIDDYHPLFIKKSENIQKKNENLNIKLNLIESSINKLHDTELEHARVTQGGEIYKDIDKKIKEKKDELNIINSLLITLSNIQDNDIKFFENISKEYEKSCQDDDEFKKILNKNLEIKNTLIKLEKIRSLQKEKEGINYLIQSSSDTISYYKNQLIDIPCINSPECKIFNIKEDALTRIQFEDNKIKAFEEKKKTLNQDIIEKCNIINILPKEVEAKIKEILKIIEKSGNQYFQDIDNHKSTIQKKYNDIQNKININNNKILNNQNIKLSIEKEIEILQKNRLDIQTKEINILNSYESIDNLKNDLKKFIQEKNKILEEIKNNQFEYKKYEYLLDIAKNASKENATLLEHKNKLNLFRYAKTAFSDKGLISYEMISKSPLLLAKGNEILKKCFNRYELKIVQKLTKTKTIFNIKIHDNKLDVDRPLDSLSGAEQVCVELALELTFLSYLKNYRGFHIETIFMDELDSSLDTENLGLVFKILDKCRKELGIKQIFIVSHKSNNYDDTQKMKLTKNGIQKF